MSNVKWTRSKLGHWRKDDRLITTARVSQRFQCQNIILTWEILTSFEKSLGEDPQTPKHPSLGKILNPPLNQSSRSHRSNYRYRNKWPLELTDLGKGCHDSIRCLPLDHHKALRRGKVRHRHDCACAVLLRMWPRMHPKLPIPPIRHRLKRTRSYSAF